MAENRPTEETVNGDCGHSRMPHVLLTIESGQVQETPSDVRYTLASINPRTAFSCGVRTAERSRIFVSNISSTIRGIQPLIQQAVRSKLLHYKCWRQHIELINFSVVTA